MRLLNKTANFCSSLYCPTNTIQIYLFGNYILSMFYVGHHLKTKISFPHSCMKDLGDYPFLLQHLKKAVEGRCLPQNGFLIQILTMKGYEKQKGIRIHSIEVTEEACQAIINFDCLCFKPQKGDIIDFFVDQISNDMIHGKLGVAEIIIPRQKISGLIYNESDNIYETEEEIGVQQMITVSTSLRCRVLEWIVGDINMKIIAEVDQLLLQSKFPNKYH